jgi:hypothetical protein
MRAWILFPAFALLACSSGQESSSPALLSSQQELCAGAAPRYEGGYATSAACPFSQHADNVVKFGQALPGPSALFDPSGAQVATLTHSCNEWSVGADAQGVAIVVNTSTGEVRSHGQVHAGQATSTLPLRLELPLRIQR